MITLSQTVRNIFRDNEFTPDALQLDRLFSYVPVFLYGAEQKGCSNNVILQGFPRIGVGLTKQAAFTLYVCDHEPVVLETPQDLKYAVWGEVYLVPPKIIRQLDANFCRGVHFNRGMQQIIYQPTEHSGIQHPKYCAWAFMYVGIAEAWKKYKSPQKVGLTRSTFSHPNWFYRYSQKEDSDNSNALYRHLM